MKKEMKIILGIVGIVTVLLIGMVYIYIDGQAAVSSKSEEVIVEIPNGYSRKEIMNKLDESGLIKNKTVADIYLKINKYNSLKANTYILNKNMSLKEILDIIETGDFNYILKTKLTLNEGGTIPQYAQLVADVINSTSKTGTQITKDDVIKKWNDQEYLKTLIKDNWFMSDEILNPDIKYALEGYLAPNTYLITEQNPTIESLTKVVLKQTDSVLTKYKKQISNFKINDKSVTVHQFLSFASVVERESLFDEDRPKIAGVFLNRLKIGMKLQSDITVLYALQETRVGVTNKDLQVNSKYNTYMYEGLPVGPISSMSTVTIESCLNYESNDYFFFFATNDGKVTYTKTYAEHLSEIEKAKASGLWLED